MNDRINALGENFTIEMHVEDDHVDGVNALGLNFPIEMGFDDDHVNGPTIDSTFQENGAASISNKQKDKGKKKKEYAEVEVTKKKVGRPKKVSKRRYETRFNGECSHAADLVDNSSSSDDPDYADEIVYSDWELFDEDDEMGFGGNISDGEGEDSDGLASYHGSSDEFAEDAGIFKVKSKRMFSKWKEFNKNFDMKRPTFELGMAFPNSVVFKNAIRKHAVLTKKELRFAKNTRYKVKVICKTSPDCPFWIYATSPSKNIPTLYIRTLRPQHMCNELVGKVYHCHAPFIANEYLDCFMNDPKWSREGVQNVVGRDFGMDIGYQICYRAKRIAMKLAQGSFEQQYNLLESYAHELKKTNPGTSVWIHTEMEGDIYRFKRIYICLEALKVGRKASCRKLICLDGCYLKGVHKGQLFAAVGIDGNNGMYPIAYAVVELENKETWTWFLQFLQEDLELWNSYHYAFISDK
ncbi:uncharacterized protein LOC133724964 [Rosa rugosa]|uniref:uncharacterized protein LOC133724964 n=1 Tax=Rosa rugosa TaxID=74645 RepID=UPI002B404C2D|nr:uncharacterized protein LOC133724964 [Rosa rugosa]XP_062007933.1 uncharacterized protein LOC133724964 [Rosa rugosa]XP_062007934.1 uncharacterized protein LOC133724964 [Rosa rugosa]XP_062007935.1 uncharacterized protein LOC133724964 [Rosa rugosa]XP_062007936.1 uncharacterized protein LOC133724964 [Rosa rugosa]